VNSDQRSERAPCDAVFSHRASVHCPLSTAHCSLLTVHCPLREALASPCAFNTEGAEVFGFAIVEVVLDEAVDAAAARAATEGCA